MNAITATRENTELPQLSVLLHDAAEPLPHPADAACFGSRFDRFADAKVLLLGEATHGSSEFYRARAAITRRMVERHGFSIVAVEADWPDAARIDGYVRRDGGHDAARPAQGDAFVRFPTWMWRNLETLEFADWLRGHNQGLPAGRQVAFRGLDIYSLNQSMNAVIDFLEERDPFDAALARERYGCLFPWREDPARYGHAVVHGGRESCENEVVGQLRDLLDLRLAALDDNGKGWFDAVQNARIAVTAEKYYRALYRGAAESWNLRDRHMFATLQSLLAHGGDTAKAVVWAHNSHVGNAAATAMGWRGEFNIGELCRMAHGDECVAIGFGTDRGTVAAASEWGGRMQVKTVRPARIDSWEHAFRHAGFARSLTDWRSPSRRTLAEQLRRTLLERAIGVVYRPESEYLSHYFEAVLADQFDAYVWFEETTPVTPLGVERPEGAPETYPFGL
ncbi:erythromycin esterase family protein [Erythrobacter sp.]|jgi:erythromycin esterase-like protein|uniref:erythromycin esterase family protein n=1 Tax=Erythrobacter sp. TaxID=1042 RepID=UPI002EB47207|nr:erythromycin esterase family protein [Erythrobacter sp.]